MNKKRYYQVLYIFPVFLSLLLLNFCDSSKPNFIKLSRKGTLKLIDSLMQENVVSTPFSNIIEHFDSVDERTITISDMFLFRELSTSKQKVWGFTTKRSVLGEDESTAPKGMEIFLNDDPINFLGEHKNNSLYWNWIKTSKKIEIEYDKNYNKRFNCLILDEDESSSFETILPDGPVEFEILARRNWHPMDLEVHLDDQLLKKNTVGRNTSYFLIKSPPKPGTHTITIKASISKHIEETRPTIPRLLVNQLRVKTKNDVILFFPSSEKQQELSDGKIRVRYLSDQDESGNFNPYHNLFRICNDFILDEFAQSENPENIKKNLNLEDLSINVLMAPPQSRFEFKVYVPDNCFLEFGAGIFRYKENPRSKGVKFKVLVDTNGNRKTIFEREITSKPEKLRDQIIHEKIDLSEYANKKLNLTFLTENLEKKEQISPDKLALAFWENPLIYHPEPDNLKVILVSLDTLRADHLSSYGYHRNTSPNIDELARDGVLVENTYAQCPWTLPSHMSMLFSLNSASHQVYYNDQKVDSSLPSLASFLQKAGFITYAFTGGGYVSSIYGFSKGFDWYDDPIRGQNTSNNQNEAENLFAYTSDWLKKNKDKSFFLFLHTFQIHGPYDSPSPWNEMYLKKNASWEKIGLRVFLDRNGEDYSFSPEEKDNIISLYDGEISYTDATLIKPLVNQLKELNIYNNTLLIITSDHGEEFQEHGGWLHGRTLYNELLRVPLLIKFPNSEYKGTRISPISRVIDILPTILDIAEIKYEKDLFDGKSLLDLITKKEKEDRVFISDLAHKNLPLPCPAIIATNRDHLKFIITKSPEGIKDVETYDLLRDPNENYNIITKANQIRKGVISFLNNYYQGKMQIKRSNARIRMNKELEEKLKALGYLR
jgi:arylsulfatase A-like enzyme